MQGEQKQWKQHYWVSKKENDFGDIHNMKLKVYCTVKTFIMSKKSKYSRVKISTQASEIQPFITHNTTVL